MKLVFNSLLLNPFPVLSAPLHKSAAGRELKQKAQKYNHNTHKYTYNFYKSHNHIKN